MRGLLCGIDQNKNLGQEAGNVVCNDIFQNERADLVVGMDENVAGIDHAAPWNVRVGRAKGLAQLVRGLADDFQISTDRVDRHFAVHPVAPRGSFVLQNPLAAISYVNKVQDRVVHGGFLEGYGFGKNTVLYVGVKAPGFDHIDWRIEEVSKVTKKASKIEEIAARFEIHQEVNVTRGRVLATGHGAEHAHVTGAVVAREGEDGVALFGLESFERHWPLIPLCRSVGSSTGISTKSAIKIAEAAKAWGQNDDITVVTVWRNG